MTPADAADKWDFYLCRVDDASASIFLNFWFEDHRPPPEIDTLYYLGFQILEPGPHGMGVDPDAQKLHAIEDAVSDAAAEQGFYYVGRLRNDADWQLTFYAEPGKEEALRELALAHLDEGRGYRHGSKEDPDWAYYREFLFPDAERFRWMMDRRVIEQLQAEGDSLEKKRTVDHCIYFETTAGRAAFVEAIEGKGFEFSVEQPPDEGSIQLELHRVESVKLHDIHDSVMELVRLAQQHGGDYDGWGCTVETD